MWSSAFDYEMKNALRLLLAITGKIIFSYLVKFYMVIIINNFYHISTTGAIVSSLIKQHLTQEIKNLTHEVECFGSLINDEMNIQPCYIHSKQSCYCSIGYFCSWNRRKSIKQASLLCVYRIVYEFLLPVAYYFAKGMIAMN